jgi:predicted TIM-barrel fold metal-dependent hydrolase
MTAAHRIDIHHHFVPQAYKDALIAAGSACPPPGFQAPLRDWTLLRSLEEMDKAAIATSLLSITTPGIDFGNAAAARTLARACNEAGARLVADHQSRFGLFAALPLPDIAASLDEIAYALDVLKADGIGLYTNYRAKWLGHADFTPILAELDRRKAVTFVHPTAAPCCSGLQPEFNEAVIEYGTDTTRTLGSLLFSGAAARFPNIRWIFCHAGGTMPYLIERFLNEAKRPQSAKHVPDGVINALTRFHYDIAQTANPVPMASFRQLIPTRQILFGTDYPYGIGCAGHVAALDACGFSAAELAAIERDNALRLLPRLA